MTTREEWAWIAGIVEGEGYLNLRPSGRGRKYWTAFISVNMTDRDVVQRLQALTGIGHLHGPYKRQGNRKPIWSWRVGAREDVRAVLMNILPWLCSRRGERARQILAAMPERVAYPVDQIRLLHEQGRSHRAIGEEVGICYSVVQRILKGRHPGGFYRRPCLPLSSEAA